MLALFVIATAAMVFMAVGLYRADVRQDHNSFFFMSQKATASDYASTTVAYSFQVAVTIYFIYWGFTYGWSNFIFIITWLLGIIAFSAFAPVLAQFTKKHRTLFELLFGDNARLKIISALIFSASLSGLIYTEMYFSSQFLTSALINDKPELSRADAYWAVFALLMILMMAYAAIGGMKKVVATDKMQLFISYITSSLLICYVLDQTVIANRLDAHVLLITTIILYATILLWPVALRGIYKALSINISIEIPILPSIGAAIALLICVLFYLGQEDIASTATGSVIPGLLSMWREPNGIWPIIGFSLANILWQFSDYTAYHRISILKKTQNDEANSSFLRASILSTAIPSPATWSIGIFLGIALRVSGLIEPGAANVFDQFVQLVLSGAENGTLIQITVLVSLSLFIISVLYSTLDSGVIAIGQMGAIDSITGGKLKARFASLFFVIVIMLAIAAAQIAGGIDAFVLLGAVYSWGLVFAPPMLMRIFVPSIPTVWLISAVLLGAAVGTINSFNPFGLPYLATLVFPSISAICTSFLVCLVGMTASRKPQSETV